MVEGRLAVVGMGADGKEEGEGGEGEEGKEAAWSTATNLIDKRGLSQFGP